MKVRVVPKVPISGILPKNKFIEQETVLDLNKNEINRCIKFGTVYDENGNMINNEYISKMDIPLVVNPESLLLANEVTNIINGIKEEKPIVNNIPEQVKLEDYYDLKEVSCIKEHDFVIVEVEFNTSVETGKVGGNLIGLFNVIGKRPDSIEYKVEDGWVKFNNKFSSLQTLTNGDKFVFRMKPREGSTNINYRLSIKSDSDVIVKLDKEIDLSKL